jgi:hypothetical protein
LELKKSSNPDLANAALLVVSELQRLHRCIWSPWGCLLVSLPLVCFLKFRIDIYRCPYYSQVWCNLARKKDVEDLFPEFHRKHHSPAPYVLRWAQSLMHIESPLKGLLMYNLCKLYIIVMNMQSINFSPWNLPKSDLIRFAHPFPFLWDCLRHRVK